MRKIISLLIAMAIVFTLCGCRDTADNSSVQIVYEYETIYVDGTGSESQGSSDNADDNSAQDSDTGKTSSSSKPKGGWVVTPSGSTSSKDKVTGSSSGGSSTESETPPPNLTAEEKKLYKPTSVTITLYDAAKDTYGVTWNTEKKPFNPVIQVCEGSSFNAASAKEYSVNVGQYTTFTTDNREYNYYINKGIIDLSPKKTYTYRACDKAIGVVSNIGTISTKSATADSFSFVHVSDSQTYNSSNINPKDTGAHFRKTLTEISDLKPNFILHTGDMVEYSKYEGYWYNMIDYNWEYYMSIPFMPISGNHETTYRNGSNETFKHFHIKMPTQVDTKLGFFYTFDYCNARFIMLNTNRLSSNCLTDDQLVFLKSALKNNNKKWTIVAMHNPMYSVGSYGANTSKNQIAVALKNQLTELFYNSGVDLVLQGHDHQYFKSYPIKAVDTVDKSHEVRTIGGIKYDVNPKGTIYAMSGASGDQKRGVYDGISAEYKSMFERYENSGSRSYAEIQISGNRLTVNLRKVDTNRYVTNVWSYGIIKE